MLVAITFKEKDRKRDIILQDVKTQDYKKSTKAAAAERCRGSSSVPRCQLTPLPAAPQGEGFRAARGSSWASQRFRYLRSSEGDLTVAFLLQ